MNKANLFLIGPIKSGTTSLVAYLKQHPEIYVPNIKENHFFTNLVELKYNDSSMHLPRHQRHSFQITKAENYKSLFHTDKEYKYYLDASPTYFIDKQSAERIYQYNPQARIIISYRNPIERLISHALMVKQLKNLNKSISEIILDDIRRDKTKQFYDSFFTEYSLYHKSLLNFSEYFDQDHILVFNQTDLSKNTKDYFSKILKALNLLEPINEINFTRKNRNSRYRKYRLVQKISRYTPEFLKDLVFSLEKQSKTSSEDLDESLIDIIKAINTDNQSFMQSRSRYTLVQ